MTVGCGDAWPSPGQRYLDWDRHAAVSTWLNAGIPAPKVADWAGHGVDVPLRVYAKGIAGQQDGAERRISDATRLTEKTQPIGSPAGEASNADRGL